VKRAPHDKETARSVMAAKKSKKAKQAKEAAPKPNGKAVHAEASGKKSKANGKGTHGEQQPLMTHPKPAAETSAPSVERVAVERARYEEKLPVSADVSERNAAGEELAKLVDALEAFKIEKREIVAKLKDRRTGIEDRMNEMAGIYKGTKLANVLCVEKLYVETCSVDVVRTDTGEVVRTRTATKEDLQEQMDVDMAENMTAKLLDDAIAKGSAAVAAEKPTSPSMPPGEHDITDPAAVLDPSKLAPEGPIKGPDEAGYLGKDAEPPPDGGPFDDGPEDDFLGGPPA
jgi:hypothetical protein